MIKLKQSDLTEVNCLPKLVQHDHILFLFFSEPRTRHKHEIGLQVNTRMALLN